MAETPLCPASVLGPYLENLVDGRRIVILGNSLLGLSDVLVERGGRIVHVYDPDRARATTAVAKAPESSFPRVTIAPFQEDLGVRDGAFDVAIVPDLLEFDDPARLLQLARRLVSSRGALVVAARNREAVPRIFNTAHPGPAKEPIDYYDFYDLMSLHFEEVRMLGQAPTVAYTIAEFAYEGEPEVVVDNTLLGESEAPEWFIAVASNEPVELEPYAVVGVPVAAALGDEEPTTHDTPTRIRPDPAPHLALTEAQTRIAMMSTELEKLREAAQQRDGAEERLLAAERRAGDAHVRAERLVQQVRDLELELVRQRDRGFNLSQQLEETKRAKTKADLELSMMRKSPELSEARERALSAEARLAHAEQKIAELEDEHLITQRPPAPDAEIITAVIEPPPTLDSQAPAPAPLAERVEIAERRVAELSAELESETTRRVAAEARVLELEEQVATLKNALSAPQQGNDAEDVGRLEQALKERGAALDQLRADLRESERVGRELVEELLTLRAQREPSGGDEGQGEGEGGFGHSFGGEGSPPADLPSPLAKRAAKAEADLCAAAWKIAELERKLLAAKSQRPESTARQLESALVAAHREISHLRGGPLGAPEGTGPTPATAQQQVLLMQLAGELAASEQRAEVARGDEPR